MAGSGPHPVKSREAVARLAPVGLLVLSVVVAGCAESIEGLHPPAPGERVKPIYVINHGWHTGIAVRRADIPKGVWPEHRDLPASEFVEVGWGDRDFYVAPEGTLWLAVRAAVWSRSSVLHLVWFDGPVAQFFRQGEIVEVFVSDRGFHQLAVLIEDAYVKDGSGRAIVLGPGQHANSRFYVAREKYSLLNTCNVWTARGLRAAGLPITPLYAVTAGSVMEQARKSGTVVAP